MEIFLKKMPAFSKKPIFYDSTTIPSLVPGSGYATVKRIKFYKVSEVSLIFVEKFALCRNE